MLTIYEKQLFAIKSKNIDRLDALCQSIALLLQIDSPFQEKSVSFEDLRRYTDIDAIRAEVPVRIKNLEAILKVDYELTEIRVASVEEDGEDGVDIVLDVVTPYANRQVTVTV